LRQFADRWAYRNGGFEQRFTCSFQRLFCTLKRNDDFRAHEVITDNRGTGMTLNFQDMMGKVQEMQTKMAEAQEKLKALETAVEVGGGMVRVTANGKQEITSITIEKSIVSADDVELLEDLVLSGVNKALEASQALAKAELGKATSGMLPNISGLDLSQFGL